MSDLLGRIVASKRAELEKAKASAPGREVELLAARAAPPRGFERALRRAIANRQPAVIAEIKRASPSRGLIRSDFDPARIASAYASNGASCLSVLTDREYFGGSREDLIAARAACTLPVLRKDFMVDPYQVHEARAWGADCILLIVDAVPDDELAGMADAAKALGMDVLVECHDPGQLERALRLPTALIGINNRDLRTFDTRLETTLSMVSRVPADRILVTESGISRPEDVSRLLEAGVSAYLVGSALMASEDPGEALKALFFARS